MKSQATLSLLIEKKEILKVTPDKLSPRGCEFMCSQDQINLFRDNGENTGRYCSFQVRLGLYPHAGPCPQYVTANGQVISVRRSAQDCFRIVLSFDAVNQDGYRLIAEHLSDPVVTPINAILAKRA
jgi:hypothetical protein